MSRTANSSPHVGTVRPLGIMDIIREALGIYKSHFLLLLGIGAVSGVPQALYYTFGGKYGLQSPAHWLLMLLGTTIIAAQTIAVCHTCIGRRDFHGELPALDCGAFCAACRPGIWNSF